MFPPELFREQKRKRTECKQTLRVSCTAVSPRHFEERMRRESYRPLFTSRREHHFAEVLAAFEIALRGASFRQRESLIDNHSKFSIVDEF